VRDWRRAHRYLLLNQITSPIQPQEESSKPVTRPVRQNSYIPPKNHESSQEESMEMHAIQPKQASISSDCIVANSEVATWPNSRLSGQLAFPFLC
jgi:hypothetical protein